MQIPGALCNYLGNLGLIPIGLVCLTVLKSVSIVAKSSVKASSVFGESIGKSLENAATKRGKALEKSALNFRLFEVQLPAHRSAEATRVVSPTSADLHNFDKD